MKIAILLFAAAVLATAQTTPPTATSSTPDTIRCEASDQYGNYMEIVIWPADVAIYLSDNLLLTPDVLKLPDYHQITRSRVANRAAWLALPEDRRVGFVKYGLNMPTARVTAACIQAIWDTTKAPK